MKCWTILLSAALFAPSGLAAYEVAVPIEVQADFLHAEAGGDETDASDVSWDASGVFALNEDVNLYARVAKGFRAPSIQGRLAFAPPDAPNGGVSTADSEEVMSFEAGIKADLWDRRARIGFNVSLGAQWQMSSEWAVGLVLRTPIVQFYQSFERRQFRLGADVAPDGTPTVVTDFAPDRGSSFGASVYLNFSGVLALAWTPRDDTFIGLELELQPGSEDDDIVRQLVWNVRLGGILPVSKTVRFGAGVFTDRSWEPRPTEAWRDRVNYYGVATGVLLETPLPLAGRPESDALVFTSTFALRYAVGIGETPRAVADPLGFRTDEPLHRLDLVFHEISLHVGSGLRF